MPETIEEQEAQFIKGFEKTGAFGVRLQLESGGYPTTMQRLVRNWLIEQDRKSQSATIDRQLEQAKREKWANTRDIRHDFVHGIMRANTSLTGEREIRRHLYVGDTLQIKSISYTHEQGWEFHTSALNLARRTVNHLVTIGKVLLPDQLDNLPR